MPVINGRYYINPARGAAIEKARSISKHGGADRSDEALQSVHRSDDSHDEIDELRREDSKQDPLQRIEIECVEIGSRQPGPKQRSYIAHVHRHGCGLAPDNQNVPGHLPTGVFAPTSRTQVFMDPIELIDFLRDELTGSANNDSLRNVLDEADR
jgi:hypothetical protein